MSEHKDKILGFYRRYKRMPGYQEIMNLVGFKSKNAVYKLINKLVAEGVVKKDTKGRITPNKLIGEVSLLGLVEAGIPSTADEAVLDTMNIDEYLVDNADSTFLLEVKGDSMIDAGIREKDLVVAVKSAGKEPKIGDIVIAEVDGGWTMKYYRKKGSTVYLQPANKNFKDIYPEESLNIAAIVKGVVRKY
jgi:SOS regulatory protein LexA